MSDHKIQAQFGLGARPALKCNIIFTDRFFTTVMFNGKRIITPQLNSHVVLTEPKTMHMPFSFFGIFLVTISVFIRGANFAIGDQETCREDAVQPFSN